MLPFIEAFETASQAPLSPTWDVNARIRTLLLGAKAAGDRLEGSGQ